MRVSVDATCKEVLSEFLSLHATELFPLPDTTTVIMTCVNGISTIHDMPYVDVGSIQDFTVLLTTISLWPCPRSPRG